MFRGEGSRELAPSGVRQWNLQPMKEIETGVIKCDGKSFGKASPVRDDLLCSTILLYIMFYYSMIYVVQSF